MRLTEESQLLTSVKRTICVVYLYPYRRYGLNVAVRYCTLLISSLPSLPRIVSDTGNNGQKWMEKGIICDNNELQGNIRNVRDYKG